MVELSFTNTARQNYFENFKNIDSADSVDGLVEYKELSLEKEIRRSGKWFLDETKSEELGQENYFCLVGNLKVYRAVRNHDGNIVITTAYKYNKTLKNYMNQIKRCKSLDDELALKRN
jgi:hypothetical protein